MKIEMLKLNNYRSHKNTTIKFTDGITAIVGKTGAGKSSIPSAISYALFGETLLGKNDELIRDNEKATSVGISFKLNSINYAVIREYSKGTKLNLYINKTLKNGNTVKETQERINSILGLDFDLFKRSIYFGQGESNSFSILTPAIAKDIVMNLLQLSKYDSYYEKVKKQLNKYLELLNTINNRIDKAKGIIDALKTDSITKEDINKYKEKNKIIKIDDSVLKQLSEKEEKIKEKFYKIKSLVEKNNSDISKLSKLNNECPLCKSELSKKKVEETINSIKNINNEASRKLNLLKKSLEELNIKSNKESSRLEEIKERNRQIELKVNALMTRLEGIKKANNASNKLRVSLKKYKEANELTVKKIGIYEKLENIFGKNGLKVYIINSAIPEIEDIANDLLERLTDGNIQVQLNTQRTGKTGNIIDTFDIVVLENDMPRVYKTYSGGEKFLIDFSIRIALSTLLSRRKGFELDNIIIDEGFGALDDKYKDKIVWTIYDTLKNYSFKQVLIITHIESIVENIENKIKIVKENRISKVI